MSKELYLPPIRRLAALLPKDAAPPAKLLPVAKAPAALLPSHELANHNLQLNRLKGNVLAALSTHFTNFYTSHLSKAASSAMRGVIKDDVLYLPMLYSDANVSYRVGVRRIVLCLTNQHEIISLPAKEFNSIKNPDAHVWVCFSQALLDNIVNGEALRLASAPGQKIDVITAELVLKNKVKEKETGEEITLFIALAC